MIMKVKLKEDRVNGEELLYKSWEREKEIETNKFNTFVW